MIDPGVDGHHAVKNAGLRIGVKLDQNGWFHIGEIKMREQGVPSLKP
jgi:hypothetical protein